MKKQEKLNIDNHHGTLCNYVQKCASNNEKSMSFRTTVRIIGPPPQFTLPQPPNPISYLNLSSSSNEKFLLHYLHVNNNSNNNQNKTLINDFQSDKCNYFKIHHIKYSSMTKVNNLITGSNLNSSLSSVNNLFKSTTKMVLQNNADSTNSKNFIKYNFINNHMTTNSILNSNRKNIDSNSINSNDINNGHFQHNFYIYSAIILLSITLMILAFYFLFARNIQKSYKKRKSKNGIIIMKNNGNDTNSCSNQAILSNSKAKFHNLIHHHQTKTACSSESTYICSSSNSNNPKNLLDETTCSSPNYRNLIIENNNLDSNNYNHIVFIPTVPPTGDIAFSKIDRTSSFRMPSYTINNQSHDFNKLLKQKTATLVLNQNQKSESFRINNSNNSTSSNHCKKDKKKSTKKNKKLSDNFSLLTCSGGGGGSDVITTSLSTTSASSNSDEIPESHSILQHLGSYTTNNPNFIHKQPDQAHNNHYQKLFCPNNTALIQNQNNLLASATLNRNQTAILYNPDSLLTSPKLIQIVNLDSIVNQGQPKFYECIQLVNLIDPNNFENQNLGLTNQLKQEPINVKNECEQVYDIIEDIASNGNSNSNLAASHFKPISPKLRATSQSYRALNESFKKKYPKTNPNYSFRINNS